MECRHTVGQPVNFVPGIAFLLREKLRTVRDDQPHVTNAGFINAWIEYLVKDSVAQREPDPATVAERGAHAGFGAGGPARLSAGSARRVMI
jgi:hypothetical protein